MALVWTLATDTSHDPLPISSSSSSSSFHEVAQAFILATPPKVAQNWFPPEERVTATSIGALANQLGVAVSFYLSPLVVQDNPKNVPLLMFVECLIAVVAFLLILFLFRSEPPSPPSYSAVVESINTSSTVGDMNETDSLISAQQASPRVMLRLLLTNTQYVLLTVSMGITIAMSYSLATLLGQIGDAFSYSSQDAGAFGSTLTLVGLAGIILSGYLADRLKTRHKSLILIAMVGVTFSLLWFTLACQPNNYASLIAACGIYGFFISSILPVIFDLSVELTFPLPELMSSSVLMISAQVFGIILISIFSALPSGRAGTMAGLWALFSLQAILTIVMMKLRVRYRRLEQEAIREAAHS